MTTAAETYVSRTETEPALAPRVEPTVWGTPGAGPLTADEAESYDRDGYLVLERVIDQAGIDQLDDDLDRVALEVGADDERVIREPGGDTIRSIFEIHELSPVVAAIARQAWLLGRVEQVLGSEAYIHQSRVNFKPGLRGKEFYWHSDFETWHFEDGMPRMRAVSVSINLTENRDDNGSLMIIPGSHRIFVGCQGVTPDEHYKQSLRAQHYGVPGDAALTQLAEEHGIAQIAAPPGSAVFFDSNCMHGSNSNITPFPRRNLFLVFNSVDNALVEPFGGTTPRPGFIAARGVNPLRVEGS